jgi:YidC/Oxa1 family membrane protein insertase
MGTIMSWVYTAISWIMLEWHSLWDHAGVGEWAKTNWQWTLAIVFLVLTVRTILFPVVVKQIKSQRAIQALQPKIKELQEKHKGDRQALQAAQMELMRQEKANPLMGCLPMVIQIPVFIGVFHVLRHLKPTQPIHNRTLYGWSLNEFYSASHAKLFGAPIAASIKSDNADLLALHTSRTNVTVVAGILIAIMIITTYLTSRQLILKTGRATDPTQRMMQNVMMYFIPVSLLVSGSIFPIGAVIYYVTTNLFSLGQQYYVLRKFPPPPMPAAAPGQGGGLASIFGNRTAPAATNGKPAIGAKPMLGAKPATAGKPMLNGKSVGAQKSGTGKAAKNGTPVVEVKPPVGPKVGAKPSNPKKGTPTKSNPTKR